MQQDTHSLFSLENIYRAYRQCRRRKRNTYNALIFEQNLEENILELHETLNNRSYTPKPSIAFLVEKPKRREIFAADFRDRIVHHVLVNYMEPQWERRFIYDSYACRQAKGTHKAVERLRGFTRKVTANGSRRAWYLQLDVRGFFITINRHILFKRLTKHETDPTIVWLIQIFLFNDLTKNCRLRDASRSDFESLPAHKTLFKTAPDCGLPIGNLTSQFFGNIYLDALDQFVKHQLKARYYLRYCDDFIILSEDKLQLETWEKQISTFLNDNLQLFMARLVNYFMIIQLGSFWEMRFSSACSYRFHNRDLAEMKILLWETGKQISGIMERALTYRWSINYN
jgi:retron-type reverse transcriptase